MLQLVNAIVLVIHVCCLQRMEHQCFNVLKVMDTYRIIQPYPDALSVQFTATSQASAKKPVSVDDAILALSKEKTQHGSSLSLRINVC